MVYNWSEPQGVAAFYRMSEDTVFAPHSVTVTTLIHELAHRVWFKALGGNGRSKQVVESFA